MVGREAQQVHVACGACGRAWNWHVSDTSGAWWRVAACGARAREAGTLAGACDAVSSRSWLGFARDWPFCLPMPFLWLLNEQNVDSRELQVLWA